MSATVGAVDFGASSIRICRITFGDGPPQLEVVHRHAHVPVHDGAHLRWDWERLVAEMEHGLDAAMDAGPLASIGVDTWGVDYGLLDHRGELVEPPISYRDTRTDGHQAVLDRIGADHFFSTTGLQALPIDTIFQLAAHDRAQLARARCMLMLPELLVHHLTGVVTGEYSSAGTTGLLDVHARTWSSDITDRVGVPISLLPPLQPAGTLVGKWRGIPVHLVGGHDTASAVLAGTAADAPFVATGTWLLVGHERPAPDTSDAAFAAGLSNELGALGGVRLLRNVAGWWLVEECRRQWGDPDLDELLVAAAAVAEFPIVDALDDRLLAPADMAGTIAELAHLADATDRAAVTRCAVESMAASAAQVLASLPDDRSGADAIAARVRGRDPLAAAARGARAADVARDQSRTGRGRRARERARASPRARDVRERRRCPCDTRGPRGGSPVNVDALERLELMRRKLDTDGRIRVVELASELDVSEMTIRRDLDLLVDEGIATRVRGGAVAVGPQEFDARFRQHARAKGRIAEKLLDLVGTGGAIGIDASSTMQRLAARLGQARDVTVLTNGPDTFRALHEHAGVTALLTGGELDPRTGSLVGPLATRAAHDLLLRRLFVSAAAVDPDVGASEATLEEAEVKIALAGSASEVILAVDASKLGHRAPAHGFAWERVDALVTELAPRDSRLDAYREHVRII